MTFLPRVHVYEHSMPYLLLVEESFKLHFWTKFTNNNLKYTNEPDGMLFPLNRTGQIRPFRKKSSAVSPQVFVWYPHNTICSALSWQQGKQERNKREDLSLVVICLYLNIKNINSNKQIYCFFCYKMLWRSCVLRILSCHFSELYMVHTKHRIPYLRCLTLLSFGYLTKKKKKSLEMELITFFFYF